MFSNTGLKKLLNRSEFLFSFLSSFNKIAPNGTVSHEISQTPWVLKSSSESGVDIRSTSSCQRSDLIAGINICWDLNFSDLDFSDLNFSDLDFSDPVDFSDLNFSDLDFSDLDFSDLNFSDLDF